MRASATGWRLLAAAFVAIATGSAASAQAPPPSPEAADIASCLCLKQEVDALSAETSSRQRELDEIRAELDRIGGQLEAERARMDVNNPEAVARFRQLLERRDDLFRRSSGEVVAGVSSTTERYNARVGEYNARCANRPRDPRLLAQVQATLSCR
jgi:hypothetical protein